MKITIITICYNSEKYIRQCIESVIAQRYKNIEYIIIDGCSTDNTLQILYEYSDRISKIISEEDSGISDAMNKGIRCANGQYILFLHSDDFLLSSDSIACAVKKIDINSDINAFSILFGSKKKFKKLKSRKFNLLTFFKMPIRHQGAFCKKSLFEKIGSFDDKLKINMDYDFFLRAYNRHASLKCFDMPLSFMRDTGISSKKDWYNLEKRFMEERKIHYKNTNNKYMKFIYSLYWLFYKKYRYLLVKLKG
jgi:glycosyltransferase involved in cell wall biosynthesis